MTCTSREEGCAVWQMPLKKKCWSRWRKEGEHNKGHNSIRLHCRVNLLLLPLTPWNTHVDKWNTEVLKRWEKAVDSWAVYLPWEERDCGCTYKLICWLIFSTLFAAVNFPCDMSFHGLTFLRRNLITWCNLELSWPFWIQTGIIYFSLSSLSATLKTINIRPRKYIFFLIKWMYRSRFNHQLVLCKLC